jgi:LPS export ABC transporter protein LptC/lipopolysaccharide transport protein LptA
MTRWQRHLRFLLAIFIVVLTVSLVVSLRRPKAPAAPFHIPPKSDPSVVAESTAGHLLRLLGGKPDISVEHYDKLMQYADGRTRFMGVRFVVLQRQGKDFTISSATADLAGQAPGVDVLLKGSVKITSTDGLDVRTEEAAYANDRGVVSAAGPVAFTRTGLTGTSVGMTYDKGSDVLTLLDQVVIHRDESPGGGGGLDIQAGTATMDRAAKTIHFERGVQLTREGEVIVASEATAFLTEDEERVERLELRGSSRVTGSPKEDGGLKAMQARDIDLTYADDGRTLQHALLNGDGVIDLAGAGGSTGRRLAGQTIDIVLAPDGTTVTQIFAQGQVALDLPRDAATPARTIHSSALQASGEPSVGLKAAAFSGGVDFRESPAPPAAARIARSSTLALALQHGFSRIDSARFGGGVRFQEGSLTATARDADYRIADANLRLAGRDEKTHRSPEVVDERATIEGDKIEIVLDGRKITANAAVKTEMRNGGESPGPHHSPAMLEPDKPVHATADHLAYDSAAGLAAYTGTAELWQDDLTIKADAITLDNQKGDLSARGNVLSTMMFDQAKGKATPKDKVRSVASAPEMLYVDTSRSVAYSGGAHLDGQQGDLTADRIVLFLEEGGHQVQRLEADRTVALLTPEGRKATGTHLTYLAAAEQYDMLGTPVKLNDESGETTGNSLTFFRSADRIIVDGKEQKRTEVKREIKR